MKTRDKLTWHDFFTGRQRQLVRSCRKYATDTPAGLPGHQLMMIINRMADLLDGADLHLLPEQQDNWLQERREEEQ